MKEKKIFTVLDFLKLINKYQNKDDINFYFRGENGNFIERIPGIYRTIENNTKFRYSKLVYEGTRDYYYDLFSELGWSTNSIKYFEQIVDAQHFGAVTSFLDITSNPLAALFFSASGNFSEDGKVYVYATKPESVKRYFGHTISLMTALNFVPKKDINDFLNLFNLLKSYISPKSELGISIFKRDITLQEFLHNIENSFDKPSIADISDNKFIINYLKNPFIEQILRINRNGKIITKKQNSNKAKNNIIKFIKDIYPNPNDRTLHYETFSLNILDLKSYQDYLIQKISDKITIFLNLLNQVSINTDKFIYPYAIFEDMQKSYIVYPSRLNERIKNQKGAFIMPGYFSSEKMSINEIQSNINRSINKSIKEKARIIVDSNSKKQILNELRRLGIDEGFIYPDIEHISKTISEKYES